MGCERSDRRTDREAKPRPKKPERRRGKRDPRYRGMRWCFENRPGVDMRDGQ